jgi:hypothetical protein
MTSASPFPFFKCQRAGGANFNAGGAVQAPVFTYRLIGESGHYPLEAPVSETQQGFFLVFLAFPDTAPAEDAFIGVVGEERVAGIYRQVA